MTTQPEALRLCEIVDDLREPTEFQRDAAAELRRLHAETERLQQINQSHEMKLSVRGYELQIDDLKAVNKELLAALEKLARLGNGERYGNSDGNMIARAAIAKGETK